MGVLASCAVTAPPVPSSGRADAEKAGSEQTTAIKAQSDGSSAPSAETAGEAIACEPQSGQPEALSTSENAAVFDQFNFQPESMEVADSAVVVKTPRYTFSLCKDEGNAEWSILSVDSSADATEDDFDYDQHLAKIADPAYESVELGGETYQYRVRLQAQWLVEATKPDTQPAEEIGVGQADGDEAAPETEDLVVFELKKPDGEMVSQQLYTLSDLQDASLGASLGVPSVAGAVVTESATGTAKADTVDTASIWFAASASQGEGDSGFASLIQYDVASGEIVVSQPADIQGDQITAIAATGSALSTESSGDQAPLTLWLGTKRSGEGNPYYPASGLVAYQPALEAASDAKAVTGYTITNSPLVGAIPYQLAVADEALWVSTGNGVCEVQWQEITKANSWDCWRFTTTAALPTAGVDLYETFLATEPATTLKGETLEALWVTQSQPEAGLEPDTTAKIRYEVAYDKGFEAELSQGGYKLTNPVARRAVDDEPIFWPGRQWHWAGDRFSRTLDEVSLNYVGGGPYGLVSSRATNGFDFDHRAIRGEFDLLSLTEESTKVRYYSGWVNSEDIEVYPAIVPVDTPDELASNPLTEISKTLTTPQGP